MPAPKDPKKYEEWRRKLREAKKDWVPWNKGLKISEDPKYDGFRKKISDFNKGRVSPNKGRKLTKEQREEISKRQKGKRQGFAKGGKHSEETKRKMSESHKGKSNGPLTDEQKAKISETVKQLHEDGVYDFLVGREISDETRQKISDGNKAFSQTEKGKKLRAKHSKRLSERQSGCTLPESHKQAISKANKKYFNQVHIREEISKRSTALWEDKEFRAKMLEIMSSDEAREKKSKASKKRWTDPEYKEMMSKMLSRTATERWSDPETREKLLNSLKTRDFYVTGDHVSPKAGIVSYRSSYELKAYEILDNDKTVKTYEVESLGISYEFEGKTRTYIPDLLVTYKDGSQKLIEVKPEYMLEDSQNQAKFSAAQTIYGNHFEIWTEEDIT